jgi:flagellar motor switch protein FliM
MTMTTTVRPHDFQHRETLDRHHLVRLHNAFEDFTRHATVELSTSLGKAVHFTLRQVREQPWQEVVPVLGDRPYLASFSLNPIEGQALLSTSRPAVLRWVEFRLGGGWGPHYEGHTDPTDTDFTVLSGSIAPLVELLAESLSELKAVSASLSRQEANSQFVQLAGPDEMFLIATFAVEVASDAPVDLLLILPLPVVCQLSGVTRPGAKALEAQRRKMDDTVVLQAPIHLWVEIPAVELTPQEISELAVGDVVPFLHPLSQPLDVRAEGVLVARARQGHVGSKIVCSITEEVTEDDR